MISLLQFRSFVKEAKEFAPGIPEGRRIDSLREVKKPEQWMVALQRHIAERAGEHLDLRLVDPKTHKAHSWAIPQARVPKPGEQAVWALRQPTHTEQYALEAGKDKEYKIPKGYGKGTVRMERQEPAEVYHATEEGHPHTKVRFNLYPSTGPEEYAIVKTKDGREILVNKTRHRKRMKHLPVGSEKRPKLKSRTPGSVDPKNEDEVMMPKYDGAHTLLDLERKGEIPRLFSYRKPKRHTAGLIEHTHKVPKLLNTRIPDDLQKTLLRTELVGIDKKTGKALPGYEVGGMINATPPRSREKQRSRNAELVPIAIDVEKYKGKDVTGQPFSERYQLLKDIRRRTGIPITEVAESESQKRKMLDAVRRGKHRMTTEGVVLRPKDQPGKIQKAKFRPDHDVYVREVFPAHSKQGKELDRAGGFRYSHTPTGPVVGRIGTGFDHATLRDMKQNPGRYVGRAAKVEAETKFESGALSKPAFKEWHLDKGTFVEEG